MCDQNRDLKADLEYCQKDFGQILSSRELLHLREIRDVIAPYWIEQAQTGSALRFETCRFCNGPEDMEQLRANIEKLNSENTKLRDTLSAHRAALSTRDREIAQDKEKTRVAEYSYQNAAAEVKALTEKLKQARTALNFIELRVNEFGWNLHIGSGSWPIPWRYESEKINWIAMRAAALSDAPEQKPEPEENE